jgi:hypothetical protein
MHGVWNIFNLLTLFCYHQCPTEHAVACGDATEDRNDPSEHAVACRDATQGQNDPPVEDADPEATQEEPQH